MTRITRSRSVTVMASSYPSFLPDNSTPRVWRSITDNLPGPGPCIREQKCLLSAVFSTPGQSTTHTHYNTPISLVADIISRTPINQLDWNQLPSSTQTGLIQILAEIDQTIAMFTTNFWQHLSYGSVTWGVIPFVSDLVAISRAIYNLTVDLSNVSYENTYNFTATREDTGLMDDYSYSVDVKVHQSGVVDLSVVDPKFRALDWLGIHPDLATAWDLIPFSFVVDYLFPIGDYLESFRGWTTSVPFKGWISVSGDISGAKYYQRYYTNPNPAYLSDGSFYQRFYHHLTLDHMPSSLPHFEVPSITQMINMLYLFATSVAH